MKTIVSKAEIVSLIGKIQSVVSSKPTLPILANVLLEAQDDQLIISATDLTVSMRVYTEAKVIEEGAITLPARRFFHLIRELTAPQVEISSISPDVAAINSGSSHFKIHGMHKSEFPSMPDLSEAIVTEIPCSNIRDSLSRSIFAASKESSAHDVLHGVCFHSAQQKGTFIGTDGKRLAKLIADLQTPETHTGAYVIPHKAVEEMIKILDTKETTSKIYLMPDKLGIEVGSVTLITKLLSGQYPDVSRIIPEKSQKGITLHREELMTLLRQVSLFTSENNSSARFTFSDRELQLSANSGDIGEGKVSMPVNYSGPKLEIAFNPHYFLDILRHSKDEVVHFEVTDSYNPGLVYDSTNALFVIMPMRLDA